MKNMWLRSMLHLGLAGMLAAGSIMCFPTPSMAHVTSTASWSCQMEAKDTLTDKADAGLTSSLLTEAGQNVLLAPLTEAHSVEIWIYDGEDIEWTMNAVSGDGTRLNAVLREAEASEDREGELVYLDLMPVMVETENPPADTDSSEEEDDSEEDSSEEEDDSEEDLSGEEDSSDDASTGEEENSGDASTGEEENSGDNSTGTEDGSGDASTGTEDGSGNDASEKESSGEDTSQSGDETTSSGETQTLSGEMPESDASEASAEAVDEPVDEPAVLSLTEEASDSESEIDSEPEVMAVNTEEDESSSEEETESSTEETESSTEEAEPSASSENVKVEVTLTYSEGEEEKIISATVIVPIQNTVSETAVYTGTLSVCPTVYDPSVPIPIVNGSEITELYMNKGNFPAMTRYTIGGELPCVLYDGGTIKVPADATMMLDLSMVEAALEEEDQADAAAEKTEDMTLQAADTEYTLVCDEVPELDTDGVPYILGTSGLTLPVSYQWGTIKPVIVIEHLEMEDSELVWNKTNDIEWEEDDGEILLEVDDAKAGTYQITISWMENGMTLYNLKTAFFVQYANAG